MIIAKGITLLLTVSIVFAIAYRFYQQSRLNYTLIFTVLGGFILRAWCASDEFLYAWDECYHALVAKNLAENPLLPLLYKNPILPFDYHQWTLNHVWLHKPPMALWIMALSIKTLGNTEWAVRLPSLLLSVGSIYLTFRIATFIKDEKIGLLAAFFQAINGIVIEIATGRVPSEHIDNTFLFFIELAVFQIILYKNKKSIGKLLGIGITLGIAILTKWLPALIILPIFFLLLLDTEGVIKTLIKTFIVGLIAVVIVLPWQLYIFHQFPKEAAWENLYNFKHLTEVVEGHSGSWWWHILQAHKQWNEFIGIAFLWFLYRIFQDKKNKKNWVLVIWIVIPYIFFSFAKTKMVAYTLLTAPALFTVLAIFCLHLNSNVLITKWLSKIIIIGIIVLSVRYSYERLRLFRDDSKSIQETVWLKNLNTKIKDKKVLIFNVERYIELMYYTDFTAYIHLPSGLQIEDLKQKGYKIFIVKNDNVPTALLNRADVTFLSPPQYY